MNEIQKTIDEQREYFNNGETLSVDKRIHYLKKLKSEIIKEEENIAEALNKDLGKNDTESYMCEIGLVLSELSYTIKHLKKWAKPKKVKTPISQFPAKSLIYPTPYGNTLIMSPWNYPFLLALEPMISSIAAGNTVVLKTSEYSYYTNLIVKKVVEKVFERNLVLVVFGGFEENTFLINANFDYVFFTGSSKVGKIVYQKAAEHLTPVTLELGGKSPCIVDLDANIPLAAKRIVFGKFINCGQTCVAPDYILCHKNIKEKLVEHLKIQITKQFSEYPLKNENYGKIITENHYKRLINLIDQKKVIFGGKYDDHTLRIEPTILDNINYDDLVMQEEIFGPLLPILTFEDLYSSLNVINSKSTPLALYYFGEDKKKFKDVIKLCRYGGGCINDVIVHLATSDLPFGGLKESGLGSYHGKKGFDIFTHYKSIMNKKTWLDLSMRYQPYSKNTKKIIKKFLK